MALASPGPVAMVLAASILGAAGQYLIQTGSKSATKGIFSFLVNPWVMGGMVSYLVVMGLFTHAFNAAGTVRVLYPVYATTFIWGAVIAHVLYHDPIRPVHAAGMVFLFTGIVLMSHT